MTEAYALLAKVAVGVARLTHREYGAQLWTVGKIRKRGKRCVTCWNPLAPGCDAYRPITNGYNRMHRICTACIDRAS